jgi:hypothetical protein
MDLLRRTILFVEALIVFHLTIAALRFLPYAKVSRRLLRGPGETGRRTVAKEEALADEVGHALDLVRRFDFRRREDCLPRALTISRLLSRRGVATTFRLGVRRGPFEAHAWVEHRGRLVGDTRSKVDLYTPLARAPGPAAR